MQENNELLLQLISDILDLSKIEAGTFNFVYTNVDVNETCSEIIKSMGMKVSKGVELIFGELFPECYIYTDKNRFTQVISNFINNALKFTQQGSITLGYEQVSHQKIKFYVRDTGMGIPEEKQKSVFERFCEAEYFCSGYRTRTFYLQEHCFPNGRRNRRGFDRRSRFLLLVYTSVPRC